MTDTIDPNSADWYCCKKCKESFLVRDVDKYRHLIKAGMRCPNYVSCKGTLLKKKLTDKILHIDNARWIKGLDLYQASSGAGLPEERDCAVKDVRKIMLGSQVVQVHVEESSDPKKSLLMSMTFDNGKTLHLTSSTRGAVIYKVTNGR